jgi:DNA (cytosine-5)-methyltransferase 1
MRGLSLCSGIGALDLAFVLASGTAVGQVELDPFCRAVLAQHAPRYWPQALRFSDLYQFVGTECGRVDVLFSGLPCQGNSYAGKRRGRDDPRNLWPVFLRILRTTRSRWAVVENVRGLLSASADPSAGDSGLFGDILRDLVECGYAACWRVDRLPPLALLASDSVPSWWPSQPLTSTPSDRPRCPSTHRDCRDPHRPSLSEC